MRIERGDTAIFIVGPTGVGKSCIGYFTAEKLNGEIISADSRQLYRGMDIGTDKPPREFLEKIPHHFIDILDPDEYYNAGQFGKDVRIKIGDIHSRNRLPLIVGGSGLYIKSILEGLFDEKIKNPEIKRNLQNRVQNEGNEPLFLELRKVDPEFASRISVNDTLRIVRGLEVFLATGKAITQHWKESRISLNFKPVLIGLRKNRAELYKIINKRVETMLENGLIDEIKELLKKGYSQDINAFRTYGYSESIHYLQGKTTYEEMEELIKKRTRNFAKRQLTWFRKLQNITWIDIGEDKMEAVNGIISIAQSKKVKIEQ